MLLSPIRGDIIILFQSRFAARTAGKKMKGVISKATSLNMFFGDQEWEKFLKKCIELKEKTKEQCLLEYYLNKIERTVTKHTKRKPIINYIKVKLFKEISYYLIYITNKTKRNNPWLIEIMKMKSFIEKSKPETVDVIIKEALGKSCTLDRYIKQACNYT